MALNNLLKHSVALLGLTFSLALMPAIAQSQMEMNEDAWKVYKAADENLNTTYQAVIKKHQKTAGFVSGLRASETAWIKYRDAQLKMVYPSDDPDEYGSANSMCRANWMASLTDERTKQLNELLQNYKAEADSDAKFKRSEAALNTMHQKVFKSYDHKYIAVFKKCSVDWLAFRDAEAAAVKELASGAEADAREKSVKTALNILRTAELKQWVDGVAEGNVCAGSIPVH